MTDRVTLNATRRQLGLVATSGAWRPGIAQLLLVMLPRWFDAPGELPGNVVHAGPLGVRIRPERSERSSGARVLVAFSTTVMAGQQQLVETVCAAVEQVGVTATVTLGGLLKRPVTAGVAGVEVVEWADHDDLMGACDVVITHGGLGTDASGPGAWPAAADGAARARPALQRGPRRGVGGPGSASQRRGARATFRRRWIASSPSRPTAPTGGRRRRSPPSVPTRSQPRRSPPCWRRLDGPSYPVDWSTPVSPKEQSMTTVPSGTPRQQPASLGLAFTDPQRHSDRPTTTSDNAPRRCSRSPAMRRLSKPLNPSEACVPSTS